MICVYESNKSPQNPCGKSTRNFESGMKSAIAGCAQSEILTPVH